MKKKERKRKNKKETMSQPKPIRAQDGPPRSKGLDHIMHTMGQPMLNEKILQACSADMQSPHDAILYLEMRQLGDNDSSYPLYMAKVPTGRGFVEDAPRRYYVASVCQHLRRISPASAVPNPHLPIFPNYGDAGH
jgi:hypothetical protein